MTYQLPFYIQQASLNDIIIDYNWDDSGMGYYLNFDYAKQINQKIANVTIRGKIALAVGVYEWLLGRFAGFDTDQVPYYVAETAWSANINKYYAEYIEYDEDNYIGPIRGALWLGFMSLAPMLYVSENISQPDDEYEDEYLEYSPQELTDGVLYLITLVAHILPQNKLSLFKSWLGGVTNRLVEYYTMQEEDPFTNIFGHKNDKDWLGDYIAREVLDLDYHYNPKDAVKLCDQFIQQVDYRNNPLLVPPEQLTGKIKHPYQLME